MDHDLELIIARLEILEIGIINIIYNHGNIGNLFFLFSAILEMRAADGRSFGQVFPAWIIFGTLFQEFSDILEI